MVITLPKKALRTNKQCISYTKKEIQMDALGTECLMGGCLMPCSVGFLANKDSHGKGNLCCGRALHQLALI